MIAALRALFDRGGRGTRGGREGSLRRAGGDGVFALAGLGSTSSNALRQPRATMANVDGALAAVVLALVLFGTVMVYSASISLADSPRYNVATTHFLWRHVLSLGVAFVAALIAFSIPMGTWQRLAPFAFIAAFMLLIVVLIVGKGTLGAKRWIPLGPMNLQPSELMKVACVLYAADFTVRKQEYLHLIGKGFLPMGAAMVAVGGLLLWQPDLGAFGVIVVIAMGILFLGGVNARIFIAMVALLAVAVAAVIAFSPWRAQRILAYWNVWDPEYTLGKGYQLSHSLIAFGRGEWFGVGLGASVEKLHYLPEAHTDFILAVIGEELGLVGVLAVIVLFYWLIKRAFEIGRQAVALERTFAGLVAQGVGLWLGVQAFINMGVATGLLPTKGLTLPLVSYGGSALLSTLVAIALLLRVDFENRRLMRGGRA